MQAKSDVTDITSSIEPPLSKVISEKTNATSEESCTSTTQPNEAGETLRVTADNLSHNKHKHNSPVIARAAFIQNQSTNAQNEAEGDNASEISDFSDFSQESWQPVQGPIAWVQEQMRRGQSPHKILEDLVPSGTVIPEGLDPLMLWKIIISIVSEPPKRKKLTDINTLDDVLKLLKNSKKIMVLTGAGVSVSCGIPDFRSRDGIYARLAKDFPNLPDPQAMFDIHFFRSDPRPFFKFAKEIYPGQFRPSPCHYFIRLLEEKGKLQRNYTQNIDTLEQVAGIQHVVQCHGSFATASCTFCGHKVDSDAIKDDIFNQVIPRCPKCPASVQNAVMKPDIVFFGESLPEHFHNQMATDKDECDLLIVIGSSLKVRPVALIPNSLPAHVPQILINRERLHHYNFDVELLGNCDGIIGELCRRLGPGWEQLATPGPPLDEITLSSLPTPPLSPESVESRGSACCKSDEAVSPTVTTKEAYINSSSNTEEDIAIGTTDCPVSSAVVAEKALLPTPQTSERLPSGAQADEDDNSANEVVTSQSDSACAKAHKAHHHKHTGKWTFTSSRNSLALTDCVPAAPTNSCSPENPANNSCSSQQIETLVTACHKKDVMYVPNKKSHSHYWQSNSLHSHPNLDQQTAVHTTCAQDSEPLEGDDTSEKKKTLCQLEPPDSQHCRPTEKRPHSCDEAAEADSQEGEQCSEVKRQRLGSHAEDGLDKEAAVSRSDSMSQDGSLEDIRKMWCSKSRVSLANRMAENQVLYLPPSSYVFKGAEVYTDSETSDSSDDDDDEEEDDSDESSGSSGAESDSPPDQSHSTCRQGAGDVGLADSSGVEASATATAKELPDMEELQENECLSTLPGREELQVNECLSTPDIPLDVSAISTCQVSSTDEVKQS